MEPETCDGIKERDSYHREGGGAMGLTRVAVGELVLSTGWQVKLYSPHQPPIKH